MAILQPLIDMASICYEQGIRHVVISPGSRSAALTLAFVRHGGFETHVCMDERPAGFIALGIAQQIDSPVVLICTSGSAAYNFAPAVSEAFFQQIPLLVLTADRPKEWLHQYDGQTIYQNEIYGRHVKRSFEISADYTHSDAVWAINRITNEAVNAAASQPYGPVHINVPIREPFYPVETEELRPSSQIRVIKRQLAESKLPQEAWEELLEEWEDSPKILIAGGQGKHNDELNQALATISDEWGIPVLGDCISNLADDRFIKHHDLFLSTAEAADLRPDLLVTFGLSFLSKEFKQFLRKNPPKNHWHIGQDNFLADPTQSVTRIIPVTPTGFFKDLFEKIDYQLFVQNSDPENDASYGQIWSNMETKARRTKADYLKNLTYFSDLTVLDFIFKYSSTEFELHVANSMSVRYANVLASDGHFSGVFANRGTSGIDGCVSTAIGAAKVNQMPTLLVVGDVAFLYDRNGLLTESLPQNLKIVVLNNAGGNIFRMIEGPRGLGELEKFFETRHGFSARRTAEDSGVAYFSVTALSELDAAVTAFFNVPGIALFEVFCDPEDSERAWKGLKRAFRQ
ncbi:2-succinyl-5-enolpyruvyl-6-hydroxy-3-cyclohexene-1-carboxylic-acid synthase [Dyadobacter sp. MSC1_007]|jgi:2-succinyl-5-enolpyruvyl-6-hydroxy-3-cyclohexene-1-carboxylate synthase|uniref:2-succinyl-5-enolpyruvyl-6-hydroxy-3- cyclohexene-1-carboxylic-acid synthase n=1 Tax=Dyadobacter sp. MSC1_007 TaxID=2909264 RepID=UPI00202DE8F5|nr:2-succinyl-5-enolpyruvyl-6-hydroxy-3-cyclohexene-1-carboxylic-acid synthase [Dyadobacter sp. MSC1_007]